MPKINQQPDLFEWKPQNTIRRRAWSFLKSNTFYWIILGIFFLPVALLDLLFSTVIFEKNRVFQLKPYLVVLGINLLFLPFVIFKKPGQVKKIFKNQANYLYLFLFITFVILYRNDLLQRIWAIISAYWMFCFAATMIIALYLAKKQPRWLTRSLKSKLLRFLTVVVSLILMIIYQDIFVIYLSKSWFILLGCMIFVASLIVILEGPKKVLHRLKNKNTGEETEFQVEVSKIRLLDDLRKSTATVLGGLFLVIGAVFSYSNYIQSYEGQFTERYTKAVALLENEDLSVRLGGIYSLERLAHDSEKDHPTIMEIIGAFVKEKTAQRATNIKNNIKNAQSFDPDLLAALEVLKRRTSSFDKKENFLDLRGVKFGNLNLSGIDFHGIDFSNADLDNADLSSSKLNETKFTNVSFKGAIIKDVDLSDSRFEHIILESTIFHSVNFTNAVVNDTDFSTSHTDDLNFERADLYRVSFSGKQLGETNFAGASLQIVDFAGSDLSLCEGLTFSQMDEAFIDFKTKLPKDLEMRRNELLNISRQNQGYYPISFLPRLNELQPPPPPPLVPRAASPNSGTNVR